MGDQSSFYAVNGREYRTPMIPFGEVVMFKRIKPGALANKARSSWRRGVFLGRGDVTDEALVGSPEGVELARTVRRLPEGEQWSLLDVTTMRGVP